MSDPTLRELLLTTKDGDWGRDDPAPGYVPYYVIRGTDFPDVRIGRYDKIPIRFLSERSIYRRTLQEDDILIETAGGTTDRPTGRTLLITDQILDGLDLPLTCASFARFMRVDANKADARYVYWYLQRMYAAGEMEQHQVQHTGVARFQFTRFADSEEIELPSRPVQRGIADLLGAIDRKMVSNSDLLRLAPNVFKAYVENAMSLSYESKPVSDLARFVNGGAYTKDATGAGRMVIRIAELNAGPGPSTIYHELEVPDSKLARAGDILMSWSGSLDVYRWAREEAIINQHIFKVIPDGLPSWLVSDRLRSTLPTFRTIAKDKATTMGHIQRGHLRQAIVRLPTQSAVDDLDEVLGPLWERLLVAEREMLGLAVLRDVLLPELLSGRMRAPEARDLVSALS